MVVENVRIKEGKRKKGRGRRREGGKRKKTREGELHTHRSWSILIAKDVQRKRPGCNVLDLVERMPNQLAIGVDSN